MNDFNLNDLRYLMNHPNFGRAMSNPSFRSVFTQATKGHHWSDYLSRFAVEYEETNQSVNINLRDIFGNMQPKRPQETFLSYLRRSLGNIKSEFSQVRRYGMDTFPNSPDELSRLFSSGGQTNILLDMYGSVPA